jgi:hypothetical protein
LGRLWPYQQTLGQDWKDLLRKNTLAYYDREIMAVYIFKTFGLDLSYKIVKDHHGLETLFHSYITRAIFATAHFLCNLRKDSKS